jgi:o-succinylbenzoate---CoA ligase
VRVIGVEHRVLTWPIANVGAARGRSSRTAIVLAVRTARGAIGLGEAAPLPGLSRDTLADAVRAIERFGDAVREIELLADAAPRIERLADAAPMIANAVPTISDAASMIASAAPTSERLADAAPMIANAAPTSERLATPVHWTEIARRLAPNSPAARFAIETALGAALAREQGTTLAVVLAPDAKLVAPSAAVVVDDPAAAIAAVAAGASHLKIKVGPSGDLDRVRAIAAATPTARLRLDANRSWPRECVVERLAALAALPIDFVEEPCASCHELVGEPLAVPLALDESLVTLASAELARCLRDGRASGSLAALVLKPTLLGGLHACTELARTAREAGISAIITHALEGPIGTAACWELARAIDERSDVEALPRLVIEGEVPAGLAPHPALAAWRIATAAITSGACLGYELAAMLEALDDPLAPGCAPSIDDDTAHVAPGAAPTPILGGALACDSAGAAKPHVAPGSAPTPILGGALAFGGPSAAKPHVAPGSAPTPILGGVLAFGGDGAAIAEEPRRRLARRSGSRRARVVIAAPARATVAAIHEALAERVPLALIHHALPPAEQARRRAAVEAVRLPPDAAVVLFTSGSTGDARGVVLSRAALLAAAEASAIHLGWRDDDRWLAPLSLAHAGGLAIIVRCLVARRPIALLEAAAFDRARTTALLEDCTLASFVPAQLAALLDDPAWQPPPRLRAVLLGGAAASPSLLAAAAARGVPFLTSYGMTEALGQVATAPLDRAGDPRARPVALAGVTLAAGTSEAPAAIRVRAPMLATCYLDGAPITPELITSDLGYLAGGELHVVGRADDVIVTGGAKVHPATVEAVVLATPGVRAAIAFGAPDPRWGQLVAVALEVDDRFDRAGAARAWHAQLPAQARPRELVLTEALPLLATGKLDRRVAARLPRERVVYG